MRRTIAVFIMLLVFSGESAGQEKQYHLLKYKVSGTDTIPYTEIKGVEIFSIKIFDNKRQHRRNSRLIKNIKKVYPWAKLAGNKLLEYEDILRQLETDREKRKIMKQVEQEIQEEYGGELRKLTFSQGKILIKLIDRETGDTSYDLVKDFRGGFVAFFYQSFARIFGYDLKSRYEPQGEDRNIEVIVRMIESGVI